MKTIFTLLISLFFFTACEKEIILENPPINFTVDTVSVEDMVPIHVSAHEGTQILSISRNGQPMTNSLGEPILILNSLSPPNGFRTVYVEPLAAKVGDTITFTSRNTAYTINGNHVQVKTPFEEWSYDVNQYQTTQHYIVKY